MGHTVVGVGQSQRNRAAEQFILVELGFRDLSEAGQVEALVTQAETVTYSVDLGDVRAVANWTGGADVASGRDDRMGSWVDREIWRLRPCATSVGREPGTVLRPPAGIWSARIKPICWQGMARGRPTAAVVSGTRYPSLAPGWHPDPKPRCESDACDQHEPPINPGSRPGGAGSIRVPSSKARHNSTASRHCR